ncbi:hypothetical protein OG579_17150 [Williamsia herbipolensis]|uniref:PE-PGRS family protein n=1 Tax=Williamsia herbipolensis TaxID=1603258 RepID=A0AAU4K045_9NOCA|nr:hypothetical protein [Williamsia herbipolensis]
MTQPSPDHFQTNDPRFVTPSTVDRLYEGNQLPNGDVQAQLEWVRNNLFTKLLGGFGSVVAAVGAGINGIVMAITGVVNGGLATLQSWVEQLLQAGQGIPIIGPVASGLLDFFFHQSAVANTASGAASSFTSLATGIFNGWFGSGGTGKVAEVEETISAIKSAVYGSETMFTLTGTGNFVVPQGFIDGVVSAINGGDGGMAGNGQAATNSGGAAGGIDGGYISRTFTAAQLGGVGAVVPYKCGAAGGGGFGATYAAGGVGGKTTFGPTSTPFVEGSSGTSGVRAREGYLPSASRPGAGGNGGMTQQPGGAGSRSVLAPGGGGGGPGGRGGDGAAANVTDTGCGGGGGGGGGGAPGTNLGSPGGAGGNGGNYGSGGGAGGNGYDFAPKPGGNGTSGVLYINASVATTTTT